MVHVHGVVLGRPRVFTCHLLWSIGGSTLQHGPPMSFIPLSGESSSRPPAREIAWYGPFFNRQESPHTNFDDRTERLLYTKSDAHSNWFLKERRPAVTGVEATWSALRREPRELASLWPAVAPGSAVLADF